MERQRVSLIVVTLTSSKENVWSLELVSKLMNDLEYNVSVCKFGTILFESAGVPLALAQEALRLAAQKLPVKTKFVIARDYEA